MVQHVKQNKILVVDTLQQGPQLVNGQSLKETVFGMEQLVSYNLLLALQ